MPFKQRWQDLRFSRMHEGKPDDVSNQEFVQELFACCLGYLALPNPFATQVAAIYA
jgi:hypothetical protein